MGNGQRARHSSRRADREQVTDAELLAVTAADIFAADV
jgi:hypothetical protein